MTISVPQTIYGKIRIHVSLEVKMPNRRIKQRIYINTVNKNRDTLKTIITCIKGFGCLTEGFRNIQKEGNKNYTDLIARLGFLGHKFPIIC